MGAEGRGPASSRGTVRAGFEPVRREFEALLRARPGYGAALAVYHDGERCVDLWGGESYREDSLQLVFSATKAATAVAANLLAQRGVLDLDAPVASVWPEFGRAGKDRIRVRWLLSHQAGLPGVDVPITMADVVAGEPVVRALEMQVPMWEPGTAHGYHALTLGFLVGEVIRRLTGRTIGQVFAEDVAAPLGLDFWIGLPRQLEHRVAPIRVDERSATAVAAPAVLAARADPRSLHSRVFSNPRLDPLDWNTEAVHAAEIAAANGICDARSLARMYAACISEVDGRRLLDDDTVGRLTEVQADGLDVVNLEPNRWGLGFYLPFARLPFGGPRAFGHDGMGGALGFADPETGLAFGFVTDLVPELTGADPAVWRLVAAARECAAGRGR